MAWKSDNWTRRANGSCATRVNKMPLRKVTGYMRHPTIDSDEPLTVLECGHWLFKRDMGTDQVGRSRRCYKCDEGLPQDAATNNTPQETTR